MSESEIQTFKELWQSSLKEIQGGYEFHLKTKVSPQIKQNIEDLIEQEPAIVKKIKTNLDTQILTKEEADVQFSDDSGDETSSKEEKVNVQIALKFLDYQRSKYENQREKTLFDKIREIGSVENSYKRGG